MHLPNLNDIFRWLVHYRYWVIFPLAVVEGPIITVLGGFLSSIGQLSFYWVYLIVVVGDLVGDALLYVMGLYGTYVSPRILRFVGITPERLLFVEDQFKNHPKKIFSIGKVSHGIGSVALFAAGLARFPFKTFLWYNLFLTLIKSYILILIGFYFGQAYEHFSRYFDYGALALLAIFIILYVLFLKYTRSYLKMKQ